MKQQLRKRLPFLLKLLVSGGFVVWVVFEVNWLEVMGRIAAINIPALILYLILLVAGMAISARKWQRIFLFKGFQRSFKESFLAYLTGTLINNFLPSFIGGDTYRGLWLGKKDGRFSPAISTLLFDRFTGLWAAMVFTILFSLFHFKLVLMHPIWMLLDIGILCSLSIDFFFPYFEKIAILRSIASKLPERLQYLFRELGGFAHRDILVPSLSLSLLFNAIGVGAANIVLFHALGGDVRLLDYLGVIFLVSIVSSFPISVNNIGLKEWAYITFFGYLNVEAETAIAVAITSRFLQMLVSFFAVPFYFRSRDMIESWKENHDETSTPLSRDSVSAKIRIRDTKEIGRGMFTIAPISSGEKVLVWGGEYADTLGAQEARKKGKHVMQWDDNLFSIEDRGDDAGYFINHSCNPNVWMGDAYTLIAKRNIKTGEEITADYALWEANPKYISSWECLCHSENCRKRITGNDWQSPEIQTRYNGHFSPLINKKIRRIS